MRQKIVRAGEGKSDDGSKDHVFVKAKLDLGVMRARSERYELFE